MRGVVQGVVLICLACISLGYASEPHDLSWQSPQMKRLHEAIQKGKPKLVHNFWTKAKVEGTPLIERIPGNESEALVTFLWWGSSSTQRLQLFSKILPEDNSSLEMHRMGETPLFYLTCRVPLAMRTTYCFLENGDGDFHPELCRTDPHNRLKYVFPKNFITENRHISYSVLVMPEAPEQKWVMRQKKVAKGRVSENKFVSEQLGSERKIWVYTPAKYSVSHDPYPLLILFEGDVYVELVPTPTILDNMIAKGALPPLVAVLIEGSSDPELDCSSPFAKSMAEELVPWIRKNYRVSHNPAQTILAGSSVRGWASVNFAMRYPHIFGKALSLSGVCCKNLAQEELLSFSPQNPLRFYLNVGTLEIKTSEGDSGLASNQWLRDVLLSKGCRVHYAEFQGGSDYLNWQGALSEGLEVLIVN